MAITARWPATARPEKTAASDNSSLEVIDAELVDAELVDAEVVTDEEIRSWTTTSRGRRYCAIPKNIRLLSVAAALGLTLSATACSSPAQDQSGMFATNPGPVTLVKNTEDVVKGSTAVLLPAGMSDDSVMIALLDYVDIPMVSPQIDPIGGSSSTECSTSCPSDPRVTELPLQEQLSQDSDPVLVSVVMGEYETLRAQLDHKDLPSPAMVPVELAKQIGIWFPSGERGRALAVSWCESRWGDDERAFLPEWPDAGWMQINRFWHEERALRNGYSWDEVRLIMAVNLELAAEIWYESGWDAWTCVSVLR